jgi:hypothetical protein
MSVHFFHGDKGGVGKSFVAASFVDWLIARRRLSPLVVDCDMRNPDLARMFSGSTTTHNVDLRQHEGWLELLSLLDESAHREVVISLPAGVGAEVADELPAFIADATDLRREVTLLWVLSRTPDSINLLRPAMTAFAGQARAMVVLKNLFFGDAGRFGRWNESKTRTAFEEANGIVVEFPDLLDRLVDQTAMAHPPVPFCTKLEGLRFGDRSELSRWLAKIDALWTSLSGPLGVS